MTDNSKRVALALFALTVLATVLIAAALPQLELRPGIPLPSLTDAEGTVVPEHVPTISISILTLLKTIFLIIVGAVVVITGVKLRKMVPWREILAPIIAMTALGLVGLYILFSLQNVRIETEIQAPEIIPPEINIAGPELGPVSQNLIWLVWIALAAALILVGVWLFYWSARRIRRVDPVRREAERAIDALKLGSDIKSVIVRCYLQMSQALQKEKGIALEETMTARVFEALLEARGIPPEPIRQLTSLFEEARYGSRPPGPEEERQAFDCLSAIVEYSRGTKPPQ
jgi:hypothetical protein